MPTIHSCRDFKDIAVKKSIESQKFNNLGMNRGGGRVTWTTVKICQLKPATNRLLVTARQSLEWPSGRICAMGVLPQLPKSLEKIRRPANTADLIGVAPWEASQESAIVRIYQVVAASRCRRKSIENRQFFSAGRCIALEPD